MGDLIVFLTGVKAGPALSSKPAEAVKNIFEATIRSLATLCELYVRRVYAAQNAVLRLPPVLRTRGQRPRRLDPALGWQVLVTARRVQGVTTRNVVGVRQGDAEFKGISEGSGEFWQRRECHMYMNKVRQQFDQVPHLFASVDPSTYAGEETCVGLGYSWMVGKAAHLALQIIPPDKCPLPQDLNILSRLETLMYERKLERYASMKQLVAVSHMLEVWSGQSLADFRLPETVTARRVLKDEVRVVAEAEREVVAVIANTRTSEQIQELPEDIETLPLRILGLFVDKGSIGVAGLNFAQAKGYMLQWYGGPYHQMARDIKNSAKHASRGRYLRAMLQSTVGFKFAYDLFGSGTNKHLKHSMMRFFMETERASGQLFQKYVHLIADALGQPARTREEQEALFENVGLLKGFHQKMGLPKLMRWMSWNEQCEEQLPEFWAFRMVLEKHNQTDDEPTTFELDPCEIMAAENEDPATELRQLKATYGAGRLIQRISTTALYEDCKALQTATRATWCHFTDRIRNVKSPLDGLLYNVKASLGSWRSEMDQLLDWSLRDAKNLRYIGLDVDAPRGLKEKQEKIVRQFVPFVFLLAGHRSWAHFVHAYPP